MPKIQYNFSYRQKDGGWQVILSYKDLSGRWRQKSKQGLKSKKTAKAAGDDLLEKVEGLMAAEPISDELDGITLREFSEYVFRDRNLAYNTLLIYRYAILKFGDLVDKPVRDITYLDIRKAMESWDYALETIQLNIRCIKLILRYAVSPYHLRTDNPAQEIKPPKNGRKQKIRALTQAEFSALMEYMATQDDKYYMPCAIAGYTGLRFGEIMGLTWDDIDFRKSTISVTKQYGRVEHGREDIRPLKNGEKGRRVVPIPPALLRILREYKARQPLSFSRTLWPQGRPHNWNVNRRIHKILPDVSTHSLRHTYATRLLANGVDIKTVSALLGDTVTTVINVYVDYTDDMRRKAAENILKIFA